MKRVWDLLVRLWKWTGTYQYVRLALLLVLGAVVLVVLFNWQFGSSPAEERLDELNNQLLEQQTGTEVIERRSQELDTVAKEKTKKAKEARNANTRDSSFEEANRNRCVAYPEDPGCKQ